MPSTANDVVALVQRISGSKRVSTQSRLLQDFSIAGDDALEVLEILRGEFGVDLSGLRFESYFPGESDALGDHLRRKLGFKQTDKVPVTVKHLIAVVQQGRWFDPL
jgi:hypothetical protein